MCLALHGVKARVAKLQLIQIIRWRSLFVSLASVLLGSVPAAAGTIFVAWQNSGFQDGTAVHPYQTLPAALAVAAPGDTIAVRTGSYNLDGGQINKAATFRAYGGVVTITGKPSIIGTGHLPFDLVSQASDLNNLPRNPTWGYLVDRGLLPDARALCNVSNNAADWYTPPKGCTHDHVTIAKGGCTLGHVNWRAATYEGLVFWDDFFEGDGDYSFKITTLDRALYTAPNPYVLMEFDSDETIDRFPEAQHWWTKFHQDVDGDNKNPGGIGGTFAVAMGLVGLDANHDSHSELHPVYTLAINYDNQSGWAFFVRNWGYECCDGHDHRLFLETVRILLPRPFATDGRVISQDVWGTPSTGGVWWFAPGEGIVLEFHLPPPSNQGLIVGDLRIQWTEPEPMGPMSSRIQAPSIRQAPEDDEETRLNKIINNMPEDQRSQYQALIRSLAAQEEQPVSFTPITLLQGGPRDHQNPSTPITLQVAPSDYLNRRLRALCSVLKGTVPGFPDLCKHLTSVGQPTK